MKYLKHLLILFFLSVLIVLVNHYITRKAYVEKVNQSDISSLPAPEPEIQWGIAVDSFEIKEGYVRRNQFLADILEGNGLEDYGLIDRLARKSAEVFDVRNIRAGNRYYLLYPESKPASPSYFIYDIDEVEYIVYELFDELDIRRDKHKLTTILRSAEGTIESSLWNALSEDGSNPFLAVLMSEIYAWTIDFFGLQQGDKYRILYEEQIVHNDTIGLGQILAASFTHMDNEYFAYYFVQDSSADYFDEDANSLMRTFLKAPLRYSRISSGFSYRRYHPVLKIYRPHHGVDYAAPTGTPVHTVGDGVIVKMAYQRNGGGRYIKIKHNGTYSTTYMHLSAYAKGMKTGKSVKQGDVIGYVGQSGLATGPHLDFRFYRNGHAVNPLKVKSPPAKPVDSGHLKSYFKHIEIWRAALDTIGMNADEFIGVKSLI